MVREIRLYIEGGGDQSDVKRRLREGFAAFLGTLHEQCRARRIRLNVILCGGRAKTFEAFSAQVGKDPAVRCLLLVDAEGPVQGRPWAHLRARKGDEWCCPPGADDDHCHLMAQLSEAWLLCDLEALKRYYGDGFRDKMLPGREDVEAIPKRDVERALREATAQTRKGEYHKTRHAPELLGKIDPEKVCRRAAHCQRLFTSIRAAAGIPAPG